MKQTTPPAEQVEAPELQPTFGRYAEIPYDQMTPEQQEGYRALVCGLSASFSDEREQVIYEMATTLANSRWIPQGLYDRAVKALGHVGITDVIALMGEYTAISLTLAFYDVPVGAPGMKR
jgi:hypothetical protein